MMDRNKKLLNDLTTVKLAYSDSSVELDGVRAQLVLASENCDKQTRLVAKLEEDIHNLNMSSFPTATRPGDQSDPLAELETQSIMSFEHRDSIKETSGSIVPILTSQRDRYRQRNIELEELQRQHLVAINDLGDKITLLGQDNVKVFLDFLINCAAV
jgi:homeobox protein cut-like